MTWSIICLAFSLLALVGCEVHEGNWETPDGGLITYKIENFDDFANLLLHLSLEDADGHEEQVNATYDKNEDKIVFHMMGQDHFDSTEDDFEEEAETTAQLMNTAFGRSLPLLSEHVHEEHGVFGHENEGMMLLHQLAMFSHDFHDGAHTKGRTRRKRSFFSGRTNDQDDIDINTIFNETTVRICQDNLLSKHGGCSPDLAVVGSQNACAIRDEYDADEVHQFAEAEISEGCYGLCGPWCSCWDRICGDCCWHPGCLQHDQYCKNDPKSTACRFGKGVVYGQKGLHSC